MEHAMLEDPRLWVAVAFVLFVAFVYYKKLPAALGRTLDARSDKIKAELDEAARLRAEAEALLAQYQQKQAEYLKEAESIMADARLDADALRRHAETELKATLEARTNQALERISREEAQAVTDVRNHVVDISLAAARTLIADQLANMPQDQLIKLALSDIERKVH